MAKNALVVIDTQNDFCLPGAILCVKGAMNCLPHVKEAVAIAREWQIPIIWVLRAHHSSGYDVEKFRAHLYIDGNGATVEGSEGAQLVEGLDVLEEDFVIIKKRFSAFMHTPLDSILKRLGTQRLVLCGVQTPNCIRATAFDGVCLDYDQVTVLSDATASANSAVQEGNLYDMRSIGIDTPSTADWAAELDAQAPPPVSPLAAAVEDNGYDGQVEVGDVVEEGVEQQEEVVHGEEGEEAVVEEVVAAVESLAV